MIKLPVVLRGRSDPKETIGDAIAWLDELVTLAKPKKTKPANLRARSCFFSPNPNRKDRQTLHAEEVKKLLVQDFRVPEEHVVIATGDTKARGRRPVRPRLQGPVHHHATGVEGGVGLLLRLRAVFGCRAESARAVEQLLGRVLRLPRATRKKREELNRAYAFATTTSFQNAAATLRTGSLSNGFERVRSAGAGPRRRRAFEGLGGRWRGPSSSTNPYPQA